MTEDQESARAHPELKREIHEVSEKVTNLRVEVGEIKTQNTEQHKYTNATLIEVKDAIKDITKILIVAQDTKREFDRHVADNAKYLQDFFLTKESVKEIKDDVEQIKNERDRSFKTISRIKWIVIGTAVPAVILGSINLFLELVRRGIIK